MKEDTEQRTMEEESQKVVKDAPKEPEGTEASAAEPKGEGAADAKLAMVKDEHVANVLASHEYKLLLGEAAREEKDGAALATFGFMKKGSGGAVYLHSFKDEKQAADFVKTFEETEGKTGGVYKKEGTLVMGVVVYKDKEASQKLMDMILDAQ